MKADASVRKAVQTRLKYDILASTKLVNEASQSPYIAFDVVRLSVDELRRHVVRSL